MLMCTMTPLSSSDEERLPSEEVNLPENGAPSPPPSDSMEEDFQRWIKEQSTESLTFNKQQKQGSRNRSLSGASRFSSGDFRSMQSPINYSTTYGMKKQTRVATCPSSNKQFTFEMPLLKEKGTKNWAHLLSEQTGSRKNSTQDAMAGYRFRSPNLSKSQDFEQRAHFPPPYTTPARFITSQGQQDHSGWRRSLSDAWGPMPMAPASPLSPSSQMRYPSPSLEVMNYVANLNRIDMSPKNPDAHVMNTPTGQFIKSPTGKWFPVQPNYQSENVDPKVRQQAIRETAMQKTKQTERDFGDWCKSRQARSEFTAAIKKAAEEPSQFDGAFESVE